MKNEYKTVLSDVFDIEYITKKSRFLSHVKHVSTKVEAEEFISEIKKKYFDANHNTHAYRIYNDNVMHKSDDGEPSGTAGAPIMDVILKKDLYNIAVVVTRYFGGILLGAGGLVRAYSSSAALGVKSAGIVCMRECTRVRVTAKYEFHSAITSAAKKFMLDIESIEYTDEVIMYFNIPDEIINKFQNEIMQISLGSAKIEITGKKYCPFKL